MLESRGGGIDRQQEEVKSETTEKTGSKSRIQTLTVFKYSGLVGTQLGKLFFMLNCGCEAAGPNHWLGFSITHPYSWQWSWTYYPQRFYYIAAPYSFIWYILYAPAMFGYLPLMLYLYLFDTLATMIVFHYRGWWWRMLIPYVLSSQFFYNFDPIDLWSWWLSLLGIVHPFFSLLAILVKLPIGAPSWVWQWVFTSRYSTGSWENWPRYGILGAWWLAGIGLYVMKRRKQSRLNKTCLVNETVRV